MRTEIGVSKEGSVYCNKRILFVHETKDNNREQNTAGFYNSIIERLIAQRSNVNFQLFLSYISFEDLGLEISFSKFLQYGGFDESEPDLFLEEFKSRQTHFSESPVIDHSSYPCSTFLQKMEMMIPQKSITTNQTISISLSDNIHSKLKNKVTFGLTVGCYELFEQFVESFANHFLNEFENISLVICCYQVDKDRILDIVSNYSKELDSLIVLEEKWGFAVAEQGKIGEWFIKKENQSGVSFGRSVLHRALYEFSKNDVIWILDDDVVFKKNSIAELNHSIELMLSKDCFVGIGAILGDPPVPPIYVVRTQAIDFYYDNIFRNKSRFWQDDSHKSDHQIHHDLSTYRTDHLEVPLGLKNKRNLDLSNWSIFSGKSETRPVHSDWALLDAIPTRGGNTLILNKLPLVLWPNQSPRCGNIQFRRGDTMWSKLIQIERKGAICAIPLSLQQIRSKNHSAFGEVDSIRGDILGSMFTRQMDSNTFTAEKIVRGAKLRESRLIMNLFRAKYLLTFLGYDARYVRELDKTLDQMITTDYPETLVPELRSYIERQRDYISTFRGVEQL